MSARQAPAPHKPQNAQNSARTPADQGRDTARPSAPRSPHNPAERPQKPGPADLRGASPAFCGEEQPAANTAAQSGDSRLSADSAVSATEASVRLEAVDHTLALLTVEEAARRLGIGRTVCYRLISSGELESVHVGRLRKVPADAVPAYVAQLRTADRAAATRAA